MHKINRLVNLVECIDELLTVRMEYEQMQASAALQVKIVKAHQKVSLTEKKYGVKNARSPVSSEVD
ncbi:MAG: hypothetical protein ACI33P_03330 [Lysinibacillus sp.]